MTPASFPFICLKLNETVLSSMSQKTFFLCFPGLSYIYYMWFAMNCKSCTCRHSLNTLRHVPHAVSKTWGQTRPRRLIADHKIDSGAVLVPIAPIIFTLNSNVNELMAIRSLNSCICHYCVVVTVTDFVLLAICESRCEKNSITCHLLWNSLKLI